MLPGRGDRSSAPLSLEGMLGIWAHLARILGIGLGMDPPGQGYVPAYPGLGSGFKPNGLAGQKGGMGSFWCVPVTIWRAKDFSPLPVCSVVFVM